MDPFKRILLKVFHFAEYLHINIIRPQRSNFDLGEQTTLKSYGYSWGAIEYKVQSIKVAFENVANFIMVFYLQLLWKYFMLLIFLLFSFSRMSLWPKSDFSRNAGNLNRHHLIFWHVYFLLYNKNIDIWIHAWLRLSAVWYF